MCAQPRRSRPHLPLAGLALAALGAVACSDASTASSPPDEVLPQAQISADVAASTGEEVARDIQALSAAELAAGLGASASRTADGTSAAASRSVMRGAATGCAFDEASGRHVCPTFTLEGLTWERSYALLDAEGQAMAEYSPTLTASINAQWTMDGTVSGTRGDATWSATVHHARDYTVSGLAGEETSRTWNGTGSSADTTVYTAPQRTRSYGMTGTHTTTGVVFALPHAEHPYPRSGTVERTVSGTATVSGAQLVTRSVTRTVRVSFDGGETARLEVVGPERTLVCTLNLATGQVSGCA
ncbi:MAG TPA: hypothetical protein VFS08_12275 [Gemmatimonadaceae bacterium]|nr:hypothetical protein [Gemmatimonadaceae bacterium]